MKHVSEFGGVQAQEINNARSMWVKAVQQDAYGGNVLTAIVKKRPHQLVLQLNLQLDPKGIIRCFGRFQHADLPPEAAYPALLPKKSRITHLFIREAHERLLHAGVSHTLNQIRREFWIPQGRSSVRKLISSCILCRKYRGPPFALPNMPPWPKERVARSNPFQYTGVDYFGPVNVVPPHGASAQKMWVCLFTCLAVRAIHLEWISDCTAQQFVDCLSRFIARRGCPTEMISDNAPQFRLAHNIFDKAWHSVFIDSSVQAYIGRVGLRWKFTTELSPWQGGMYERLVGIVKNVFRITVRRKLLKWDEFATIITEIESVVNSRPIVHVPSEFCRGLALRPIDFFTEQPTFAPQIADSFRPVGGEATKHLISHWKHRQRRLDCLWRTWHEEYLTSLREKGQLAHRNDRCATKGSPVVDEVVLVKNEDAPRASWKLGRIINITPSRDGEIRAAEVRLPNHQVIRRPVNHLYRLEVNHSEDNVPKSTDALQTTAEPDFEGFTLEEVNDTLNRREQSCSSLLTITRNAITNCMEKSCSGIAFHVL